MILFGSIIRYHRLMQGKSQGQLCKDLCVSSYLSKIENEEISPSEDIGRALLKRLGISLNRDPLVKPMEVVKEHFMNLDYNKAKECFNHLDADYVVSDYLLEYIGFDMLFNEKNNDLISVITSNMHVLGAKRQAFICVLLYKITNQINWLNGSISLFPSGIAHYYKGKILFDESHFQRALLSFENAENLYLKEGLLFGILSAKKMQGVSLSFLYRYEEGIDVFGSLVKLFNQMNSAKYKTMKASALYNIELLKYKMDQPNDLEKVCIDFINQGLYDNCTYYHMLYEINEHKESGKAKEYIEQGLKHFMDTESSNYLLLVLDLYRLEHDDYLYQSEYLNQLLVLEEMLLKSGQTGLLYFIREALIDYYKANRKYKEALNLRELMSRN